MRALAVTVAIAALALPASAAPPPTKKPGVLTVALEMPSAGFQVGIVRGRTVILARGLEIDLAAQVAKRLGLRVRYLNEPAFSKLLKPGLGDWDLAVAQISVPRAASVPRKYSLPPMMQGSSNRPEGEPGFRSTTMAVPVAVPSETHSSMPVLRSLPWK